METDAAAALPPPPLDDAGGVAVERDVRCIHCDYNLRGLDEKSRCPECGLPAYWTLRAPQNLSQYPLRWITSMSHAVWMLLLVYGGTFAVFVIASLFRTFQGVADWLAFSVITFAAILQTIAMWMLSRPSGHFTEPAAPINTWALRIAPLGFVLATASGAWMAMQGRGDMEIVAIFGLIVGAFAPPAIFIRLRTVAGMISDAGLAEYSNIVAYGFVFSTAMILIMTWAGNSRAVRMNEWPGMTLMLVTSVSILLFVLWGAFVFFSCVIDFGRAARVARGQFEGTPDLSRRTGG